MGTIWANGPRRGLQPFNPDSLDLFGPILWPVVLWEYRVDLPDIAQPVRQQKRGSFFLHGRGRLNSVRQDGELDRVVDESLARKQASQKNCDSVQPSLAAFEFGLPRILFKWSTGEMDDADGNDQYGKCIEHRKDQKDERRRPDRAKQVIKSVDADASGEVEEEDEHAMDNLPDVCFRTFLVGR